MADREGGWWSRLSHVGGPVDASGYRVAEIGGLSDGLWVVAWVQINDEVIADARFEVYGALEALAIADWLAARIIGHARQAACRINARDALDALGLPAEAGGDALRIEDALRLALSCDAIGGSYEH